MSRPSPRRQRPGVSPPISARRDPRRRDAPRPATTSSVAQVYTLSGVTILPLRLFLGITFLYAAYQKITDPGFFALGSRTYIGTQLLQFSKGSPINFVMSHLLEHAVVIGWFTIFSEFLIGLLVVLGLFTRLAALGGLLLNLGLFLSATWSVYPFFLGSDIVFVAAWLTLALTGPGAYALEPLVVNTVTEVFNRPISRLLFGPLQPQQPARPFATVSQTGNDVVNPEDHTSPGLTRQEALLGGLAAIVIFILGVLPRSKAGGSGTVAAPAGGGPTAATPVPAPGAGTVTTAAQVPVNSAFPFTDPKSGDPAVIVHTAGDTFVAYDAVCTHAGCTVQYDPSQKLLVCPCHGGAFDPAQNATVVAGPPPSSLTALPITVDSSGNIHVA